MKLNKNIFVLLSFILILAAFVFIIMKSTGMTRRTPSEIKRVSLKLQMFDKVTKMLEELILTVEAKHGKVPELVKEKFIQTQHEELSKKFWHSYINKLNSPDKKSENSSKILAKDLGHEELERLKQVLLNMKLNSQETESP